ncbi:MAG: hypothetical protein M3299_05310, partial [Thermoproteota archaeon]|nr:hypothetical protein [Thermoproteota archaeon]
KRTIFFELSKGEKDDRITPRNMGQEREDPLQPDLSLSRDEADKDVDNIITITNHKNTLQSFIEKSTLGVQFAIIVLFYLARASVTGTSKTTSAEQSSGATDLSPFSFTSREFSDTYSQLASNMGLTKYLIRHMAFAEFMLTLEYLSLVREDELTSNYRLGVNFEDLKWLASLALQQIAGGHGLSSPEIFYPSSPRPTLSSETPQPDKTVNPTTIASTKKTADLIKDLSLSIFSQEEIELNRSGGTSRSYDGFVRPRSGDYGLHRPFFPHRVPPTMYSFRKPDDGEWKRIIKEFFEGRKCITCNTEVLPQQFDIWIGEPLEDNAIPSSKRDQRMSEVLADIDSVSLNGGGGDNAVVASADEQQNIDSHMNITDRELLTYNYGIIPMDGRDAFIAFAKPKLPCTTCGTNPGDSVSLMPKY